MAVITLPSGLEVTTFEPPPDFDPQRASAEELERFGLPPLPKDPYFLARYKQVLSLLDGKFHYIQPTLRESSERVHVPPRPLPAGGAETSASWSGGVVYAPAGHSFTWLEGEWMIPSVSAPAEGRYHASSWVGIDGDKSPDVLHAGIECEVSRVGTSITTNYFPWCAWYPGPEVQVTNFPVKPNDVVQVVVCTSGPGAGSTEAKAYFTNHTTGATTSLIFHAPAGTTLVGNSAEWILGVPTIAGQPGSLANYGQITFSECDAFLTGGIKMKGPEGDNIDMVVGGKVVSKGILVAPASIRCEYV